MTIIKRVAAIIMVIALLAVITVLSTVSAQNDTSSGMTMQPWTLTYVRGESNETTDATIGVPYTILWKVSDSSGDNDPMPSNFVSLTVDGVVVARPALPPTTASAMDATTTYTFTITGTHTLGISIPRFVSSDDGDIWPASSASTTILVGRPLPADNPLIPADLPVSTINPAPNDNPADNIAAGTQDISGIKTTPIPPTIGGMLWWLMDSWPGTVIRGVVEVGIAAIVAGTVAAILSAVVCAIAIDILWEAGKSAPEAAEGFVKAVPEIFDKALNFQPHQRGDGTTKISKLDPKITEGTISADPDPGHIDLDKWLWEIRH